MVNLRAIHKMRYDNCKIAAHTNHTTEMQPKLCQNGMIHLVDNCLGLVFFYKINSLNPKSPRIIIIEVKFVHIRRLHFGAVSNSYP